MTDSAESSVGRVFISYRREETAYAAGWLFDRLADRFGRDQIFKDVDSIQLGDDFVEVIKTAVGSCDVLIALIGHEWLTAADERGMRRLDNPSDFVRLELEAALERNVRVIPVLVEGARMPRAEDLPPSLATLVRRNALELSPNRFEFDTSRLLRVLDKTVARPPAQSSQSQPAPAPPQRQASLRALYVEARAEMRLGHLQTAIELLDDLLAIDASHRDAIHLRAVISQQLHLSGVYQKAIDAEAAGELADATSAFAEILDIDATYRDVAARHAACEARQQVLDLLGELRHHAAAEEWDGVLAVDDELAALDPAEADPDGLASIAREQLTRRQEAERAAAEHRRQVEQLQQQVRDRSAAEEWDAALAVNDELAALDPAEADPDGLASVARERLTRRQEAAERAAAEHRRQVEHLQQQIRDRSAAEEWDAALAVNDELAALDPAEADPDGLASIAREQLTRRQEAVKAPSGAEDRDRVAQVLLKTRALRDKRGILIGVASISAVAAIVAVIAAFVLQGGGGTNGLEKRSAAQVLQAAGSALQGAKSVHVTGSHIGDLAQVDLRIQGDAAAGTFELKGAQFEITRIGNDVYLKTDPRGWQALGAPAAVQSLSGRWAKFRADQVDIGTLSVAGLAAGLTTQTDSPLQPSVEQTTRDGKKAVVISKQNGQKLDVANTGPAFPLHVDSDQGPADFTEYNIDFHITAPSDAIIAG
jgi:tetratricopeptide (TPR) repeat protein